MQPVTVAVVDVRADTFGVPKSKDDGPLSWPIFTPTRNVCSDWRAGSAK